LLVQGDRLRHGPTHPEKLTHFIESATEARCRCEASKPTHGIVALLHATVVLLQSIVEILITSMENVIATDLADRTWVRTVPIRDHALWSMTDRLKGLLEKALGGVPISLLTEHRVNQIAILINGTIQVAPLSLDPHVGLINVPGDLCLSATPPPQLIDYQRRTSGFPVAHRPMSKRTPTFQEHLGKVT